MATGHERELRYSWEPAQGQLRFDLLVDAYTGSVLITNTLPGGEIEQAAIRSLAEHDLINVIRAFDATMVRVKSEVSPHRVTCATWTEWCEDGWVVMKGNGHTSCPQGVYDDPLAAVHTAARLAATHNWVADLPPQYNEGQVVYGLAYVWDEFELAPD